ncbi:MAG: DUF359 domain-containing protein [Candidatus Bilamarchaeaceae archaeon]
MQKNTPTINPPAGGFLYIVFSGKNRAQLKKPFGKKTTVENIKTKRKIVAIGDETTLRLIKINKKPYLAVCDFRIKRKKIKAGDKKKIMAAFGKIKAKYKNPPGTLSTFILKNAKKHLSTGGLVRIYGEEDITALAFMLKAGKNHIILYGQPNEGIIEVKPEKKSLKMKIKKLLTAALHHKKE